MFGSREEQSKEMSTSYNASEESAAQGSTTIGGSAVFKGEFEGSEDIEIAGTVEGTIRFPNNTVTVSRSGKVEGDIYAKVIRIEGTLTGDLYGGERVNVQQSGDVRGNITAPRVCLEDGAKLKGTVDMDPKSSEGAWKPSSVASSVEASKKSKAAVDALSETSKNGKATEGRVQ